MSFVSNIMRGFFSTFRTIGLSTIVASSTACNIAVSVRRDVIGESNEISHFSNSFLKVKVKKKKTQVWG